MRFDPAPVATPTTAEQAAENLDARDRSDSAGLQGSVRRAFYDLSSRPRTLVRPRDLAVRAAERRHTACSQRCVLSQEKSRRELELSPAGFPTGLTGGGY